MFKILTLVLMLTPSALAAQRYFLPGFIVTNSGDTVKGFVDYNTPRKMTLQCVFKVDERGQATIYSPGEISGYGFDNNKTFVVLDISEDSTKVEKAFVELLVQGDVRKRVEGSGGSGRVL